jgi:hypothetical protein
MTIASVLPNDLSISRARLEGCGRWQDGRRLLESNLSSVVIMDIVGQQEILLVPHLRISAQLSGRLPRSRFASQVTAQLQQIRREAFVDPTGTVPEGRAFRFTSHDRYAAWLILTWLKPTSLHARWMLDELLNGQSVEQWQRRTILHDGQRIISVVRALNPEGSAVSWVKRLAPDDCSVAIKSLGRAFGFAPIAFDAAGSDLRSSATGTVLPQAVLSPSQVLPTRSSVAAKYRLATSEPLRRLAKSVSTQIGSELAELSAEQQALLMTALVLAERPNIGASLDGAGWWSLPNPGNDGPAEPFHQAPPVMNRTTAAELSERDASPPQAERQNSQLAHHAKQELPDLIVPEQMHTSLHGEQSDGPKACLAPITERHSVDVAIPRQAHVQHAETEFGGIMFVLNILLALRLYPDFTEPLGRRLEPSPLWLLSQVGIHLFGKAFRRDPLFRLLRYTGQSGSLPRRWQIEPEWVEHLPMTGILRQVFDGKNLSLWDSRGFIMSDHRAKPWSRGAIRAGERAPGRHTVALPANRSDRWVACLAAFIRFRIAHAADGLAVAKLRLPATATLKDDGLEVDFPLARLPLAIRMAGLDRNPGWLPSEGRNVSFHFS